MADISMCNYMSCTKRGDCYRYLAVPAPHNSQAYGVPISCVRDHADFWPIQFRPVRSLEEADSHNINQPVKKMAR